MSEIKVLNLYAGVGGNRKLWGNVKVTAVEWMPEIAQIYRDFFPDDEVVETDAHQFLLENFQDYNFIWSSPPCPTHSKVRRWVGVKHKGFKPVYPDMNLYQEIIFLDSYFEGKYCVENVVSYYKPLIKPQELRRHYFWANFLIKPVQPHPRVLIRDGKKEDLMKAYDFDLTKYNIKDKRKVLRNCVEPDLGKIIFDSAWENTQTKLLTLDGEKSK